MGKNFINRFIAVMAAILIVCPLMKSYDSDDFVSVAEYIAAVSDSGRSAVEQTGAAMVTKPTASPKGIVTTTAADPPQKAIVTTTVAAKSAPKTTAAAAAYSEIQTYPVAEVSLYYKGNGHYEKELSCTSGDTVEIYCSGSFTGGFEVSASSEYLHCEYDFYPNSGYYYGTIKVSVDPETPSGKYTVTAEAKSPYFDYQASDSITIYVEGASTTTTLRTTTVPPETTTTLRTTTVPPETTTTLRTTTVPPETTTTLRTTTVPPETTTTLRTTTVPPETTTTLRTTTIPPETTTTLRTTTVPPETTTTLRTESRTTTTIVTYQVAEVSLYYKGNGHYEKELSCTPGDTVEIYCSGGFTGDFKVSASSEYLHCEYDFYPNSSYYSGTIKVSVDPETPSGKYTVTAEAESPYFAYQASDSIIINVKDPMPYDVNDDGKVSNADAVTLQKYLLGTGELKLWQNADANQDNIIDAFDLCLLRKELLKNNLI